MARTRRVPDFRGRACGAEQRGRALAEKTATRHGSPRQGFGAGVGPWAIGGVRFGFAAVCLAVISAAAHAADGGRKGARGEVPRSSKTFGGGPADWQAGRAQGLFGGLSRGISDRVYPKPGSGILSFVGSLFASWPDCHDLISELWQVPTRTYLLCILWNPAPMGVRSSFREPIAQSKVCCTRRYHL